MTPEIQHGDMHCDSDTPCPPGSHDRIDDGDGQWHDLHGNYVRHIKPVLPEWTRWSWASPVERSWWKPQIDDASRAFIDVERLSVAKGLRKAAWQYLDPAEVVNATRWAHDHGLIMVPAARVLQKGSYSSGTPQPSAEPPNMLRVIYVRPEHYADALPWGTNIGDWLGYPPCCQQAFAATWGRGQVDNTYEQLQASTGSPYYTTSTLLRFLGVRLVSHLPCSFHCKASATIAAQMSALGVEAGYADEMATLNEVLQWPITWSRLFGIGETVTPAVKISARTDWTPTKQAGSQIGGSYFKPEPTLWTDNGFVSGDKMRAAHSVLIESLKDRIPPKAHVLDLGCGNGILLKRLKRHRPDITIGGCDTNADAIHRAGQFTGKWFTADIGECTWFSRTPTVVLMAANRFGDMPPNAVKGVQLALMQVPQAYIYAYPDGSGPLEHMCPLPLEPIAQLPEVALGCVSIRY